MDRFGETTSIWDGAGKGESSATSNRDWRSKRTNLHTSSREMGSVNREQRLFKSIVYSEPKIVDWWPGAFGLMIAK